MRVVTWNINSVRLREQQVLKVLKDHDPDVLCLQETKTPDEHFPFDNFRAAGYGHIHIHGMKGYNGVAILSKHPFESTQIHHRVGREDCRHISVKIGQTSDLKSGFTVHNLYIPAGGDEPDPEINEKFDHKLKFVEEMTAWFKDNHGAKDPAIAVGDFNIAPHENDVWSHKQLLKIVSHTPQETERLETMRQSLDWTDVARHFTPDDEKCYSWWSYRNRDWKKSNRGRRLDHVWVTPALKPALKSFDVYTQARDFEKPSDHVPVIVDLSD